MEHVNRYPNSSDYSGVLSVLGEYRLIVGVKGTRFEVQRQRGRNWVCLTHGKTLETCLRNLSEKDDPDASAAAYEFPGLDEVPDHPGDVVRPWADLKAESEAAAFAAEISADDNPAVIWQHNDVRTLGPVQGSDVYRLQKRGAVKGWHDVATAATVRGLLPWLCATTEKERFGRRRVKSAEMLVALNALANVVEPNPQPGMMLPRQTSLTRRGAVRAGGSARVAKPRPAQRAVASPDVATNEKTA